MKVAPDLVDLVNDERINACEVEQVPQHQTCGPGSNA
jgi:hypothetical protein